MASELDIWNRAMQKLGAKRIASLTENSVNARECAAAYPLVRDAELRAHPWSFAIERFSLSADATAPSWGRANAFQLPANFVRLLPNDPEDAEIEPDYQIEGRKILTNYDAPLEVRCIVKVTDTSLMDPLFIESVASKLAFELCEKITQSNTKKADAREDYKTAVREARRTNAIENIAATPPEDSWVTVRN